MGEYEEIFKIRSVNIKKLSFSQNMMSHDVSQMEMIRVA